jgi:hypothetical protein
LEGFGGPVARIDPVRPALSIHSSYHETEMSKLERFSAALIAVAMFAAPAMAKSWHDKRGKYIEASRVVHTGGARHCIRAPAVGAFASAPYKRPPCEPAAYY